MASASEGARSAWNRPGERERRTAIMKAAMQRPEVQGAVELSRTWRGIKVPPWVPEDLAEEYRDVAATEGEEAGARHCRRLKREMAAPTRSFGYCA